MSPTFFRRKEKKYILSQARFEQVQRTIEAHMDRDNYHYATIQTVYFDNAHDELVIASIAADDYKYKIRARSYGAHSPDTVYLEIKSKLDGTVYKRRIKLTRQQYEAYINRGELPESSQVMREIDHIVRTKQLAPKQYIAYDRVAYAARDGSSLRITFDANLRSRRTNLDIGRDQECETFFASGDVIMEIKSRSGMPAWLVDCLNHNHMYPSSFSKYGKIYQRHVLQGVVYA